jgi:hypothetical protein
MTPQIEQKHDKCQVVIRWKRFKNKDTDTAELFCKDHYTHLMWLSDTMAKELITESAVPVEPYLPSMTKGTRRELIRLNRS